MNSTNSKATWKEQKVKLKQKIIALIGKDLMYDESKREEMLAKLQIKLGKTRDEVSTILDSL
ncbi:MAG: hypothetical protein JEZ09_16505 [Salinivirgaceae bacterium]|nr:hypothetical protein [Salinivirgaceae bacterium]